MARTNDKIKIKAPLIEKLQRRRRQVTSLLGPEEERGRAEAKIRKLSQFLDSVIDNANLWLDVLDEKGNVVIWNKAAEEISGYSREEVVGHDKIWEWLYPDEEYRNQVFADAVAIIETGEEERDVETTIRCKDGQTRIISWNSRSLVDEQGNPMGSVALGRDITEQMRAEESLQKAHADLARYTAGLERRTMQLQAAAEVAREAAAILDMHQLLNETVRLISDRFGFYHAGVFLMDERGEYAVLRAASSEGGQRMLKRGHKLKVGEIGIVGHAAAANEPRIALDVGGDVFFFDNPDLPDTRSEMALPLTVHGRVIGVLDVQSTEPAAFTEEDVTTLQTMADQLAIAIENARLMERAETQLRELSHLHEEYRSVAWAGPASSERPLGYVYDRIDVMPMETTPTPALDKALERGEAIALAESEETGSTLAMPLKVRNQIIGALGVQEMDEAREWSPNEIALVEAVSEQVGQALEAARLFDETQRRARREKLVAEISDKIRSAPDMDGILRTAVQEIRRALGVSHGVIRLGTETHLLRPPEAGDEERGARDGYSPPPKRRAGDRRERRRADTTTG